MTDYIPFIHDKKENKKSDDNYLQLYLEDPFLLKDEDEEEKEEERCVIIEIL